jgi:hypothetical protein
MLRIALAISVGILAIPVITMAEVGPPPAKPAPSQNVPVPTPDAAAPDPQDAINNRQLDDQTGGVSPSEPGTSQYRGYTSGTPGEMGDSPGERSASQFGFSGPAQPGPAAGSTSYDYVPRHDSAIVGHTTFGPTKAPEAPVAKAKPAKTPDPAKPDTTAPAPPRA